MRRIIGTIAATLVISIVMATSASAAVNDPNLNFSQTYDLYVSSAIWDGGILNDGGVPQISPANTYV
jgi:hypothetical protein